MGHSTPRENCNRVRCTFNISYQYSAHFINPQTGDYTCGEVRIKKNAFIGTGTIITKPVTIGERSIVGAGSVVTKNIPDNEVWAGNPARLIKKRNI